MRYPLLAFATLAVVVVGYAALAGRSASRAVDELLRLQAEKVAGIVAEAAAANDGVKTAVERQLARTDDLVADALAAQVESPDRLRSEKEVLRRWLGKVHVDRALLVDDRGQVLVDEGGPARPGKTAPAPLETIELGQLVRAAAAVARGEAPPPPGDAGPFRVLGAARVYRRIGDRCLVLARGEAALREIELEFAVPRLLRQFEGDRTVAYVKVLDGAGGTVASQDGAPAAEVHEVERALDLAGGAYRIRVGVNMDEARAVRAGALRVPLLLAVALVAAGGLAMALVFRQQHAFLRRERELRARSEQDKRLAALGRLTAGVAHEIKNPLNAIRVATARLRRRAEGEEEKIVTAIDASAGAIAETVEDFVKLARDPRMRLRDADPAAVLAEAVDQVRSMAAELGRRLDLELGEGAGTPVQIDPARLKEALVNLLRNALQASRNRVAAGLRREGDTLRFEIDDDGPGVPPDQRAEIFELFYTTKPEGTGLGLPLAHRVAEEHGGFLDVVDGPLGGARFTVRIPWR